MGNQPLSVLKCDARSCWWRTHMEILRFWQGMYNTQRRIPLSKDDRKYVCVRSLRGKERVQLV